MASLSLGVHISFELATYETLAMRHEFILPEFMFAGITKLQDLMTEEFLVELDASVRDAFRNEVQAVLQALEGMGIDVRKARRTTRALMGDGRHMRDPADILHRTPELRAAFKKANTMAEEAGYQFVGINHLLIAVLEIPDTTINVVLQVFGTTPEAVAARIRELKVDPAPVPEQDSEQLSNVPKNHDNGPKQKAPAAAPADNILDEFGTDLVEMARKGAISDVFERDDEIFKVIMTLSRAQNNNPVLIGEPGVGKTAIVEGLAYRIAKQQGVPVDFYDKRIIQVDIARVVGGTKYRGMFEERLVNIIEQAKSDPNVILFVDEIHMLVGVGATSGTAMDAGNMLKHAMSRPNFSLIGATTVNEYNSFIDRDRALERRFTPIMVREPSPSTTMRILLAGLDRLHKNHGELIQVHEEAIDSAVKMADRYMPSRSYPDKAFQLLDEACALARVAAMLNLAPDAPRNEKIPVRTSHVEEVIRQHGGGDDDMTIMERLRGMEAWLRKQIIGQEEAIVELVRAIQLSYLNLRRQGSPVGVFLFVGPTGVGKTQLAKETADLMFGGEDNIIRIDMSEYMERHSVARLIGSPPGYIGHEEGGQLTEALRMNPQTIVLLDEIEKAHADVVNIFLQVFSDGRLTDSRGRVVDASRALFLMTSNLGYREISTGMPLPSKEDVEKEIEWHFRPEFINRIDKIVHFMPLRREHMLAIVDIHFAQLRKRVSSGHQISIDISDEAREWLAEHGYDLLKGARPLLRLIEQQLTQPIGSMLINGEISQGANLIADVNPENDGLYFSSGGNTTL